MGGNNHYYVIIKNYKAQYCLNTCQNYDYIILNIDWQKGATRKLNLCIFLLKQRKLPIISQNLVMKRK